MYTKGCKANCKINRTWKIDEFYNVAPQIFDNVSGHWYQCVALCELVWMHYVDFFRSDLLKRYRQNTAENRQICSITALQYRKLLLLECFENLFFCSLIGYTSNSFVHLDFFPYAFFCEESREKRHFFQDFSFLGITNTRSIFSVYWSKVFRSLYNRVK